MDVEYFDRLSVDAVHDDVGKRRQSKFAVPSNLPAWPRCGNAFSARIRR